MKNPSMMYSGKRGAMAGVSATLATTIGEHIRATAIAAQRLASRSTRAAAIISSVAAKRQAALNRVAARIAARGGKSADPRAACEYNPNKLHCARGFTPQPSAYSDASGRRLYCCMPAPFTSKLPGK